ncbi:OST-HTH/LOTUS domain-containing protein [Marinobacter adhaerens]|uniref:OST-HTH/LOTUS domain-containing protein n=1 Tax=Marinobacter adhaerens TaxID=1033846 RepID=UPI001C56EF0D|nr:OST-HTH/LOTUS domain-containing protein [Marinobacter adhaerens]MBW3225441.1 OST-HTH/LOTUS domain-containing protein [Marinobacter adhaerens]
MSDECDKTADELRTQVFELLGRCVLNLQRYELAMKELLSLSVLGGDAETWKTNLLERKSHYSSKTLGQLIGEFTSNYLFTKSETKSENMASEQPLTEPALPQFETKLSLMLDQENYQRLLDDLAYLVATRNELVHHFLQRFSLADQDSCQQAIDHLETVREMLKSHMERLQSWNNARVRGFSVLKDSLQSPQIKAWVKFGFIPGENIDWPSAGVVEELKRAESLLSKDGWTDLTLAIEAIKNQNPELTPKAHGCVSWRNLLHTSGLFDIRRERGHGATAITYYRSR